MILNPIFYIAKKELMDNIRNTWIIIISIIFALLTILASYAGSYDKEWQSLELTISVMILIVQIVVSIIGLMLGYAAIGGEIERGSMNSLLSFPISRLEIIIGKFLGLGAVLSLTLLIGFGFAGIIISLNISNANFGGYLLFIGASILNGLVFLSLSLFYSSFFKTRIKSMGMAIFTWIIFMPILWALITGMILIASVSTEKLMAGLIPDWYFAINLINPQSAYSGLVSINIIELEADTVTSLPSFYNNGVLLSLILIWIIVPLILSYILFKRRDV